jgi:hypothetical protein
MTRGCCVPSITYMWDKVPVPMSHISKQNVMERLIKNRA